jgi:hypothetical protein
MKPPGSGISFALITFPTKTIALVLNCCSTVGKLSQHAAADAAPKMRTAEEEMSLAWTFRPNEN